MINLLPSTPKFERMVLSDWLEESGQSAKSNAIRNDKYSLLDINVGGRGNESGELRGSGDGHGNGNGYIGYDDHYNFGGGDGGGTGDGSGYGNGYGDSYENGGGEDFVVVNEWGYDSVNLN